MSCARSPRRRRTGLGANNTTPCGGVGRIAASDRARPRAARLYDLGAPSWGSWRSVPDSGTSYRADAGGRDGSKGRVANYVFIRRGKPDVATAISEIGAGSSCRVLHVPVPAGNPAFRSLSHRLAWQRKSHTICGAHCVLVRVLHDLYCVRDHRRLECWDGTAAVSERKAASGLGE